MVDGRSSFASLVRRGSSRRNSSGSKKSSSSSSATQRGGQQDGGRPTASRRQQFQQQQQATAAMAAAGGEKTTMTGINHHNSVNSRDPAPTDSSTHSTLTNGSERSGGGGGGAISSGSGGAGHNRRVSIQIPDEALALSSSSHHHHHRRGTSLSSSQHSRTRSASSSLRSSGGGGRHHSRSSSIVIPDVPEDMDCPICLDSMNKADFDHPLQCPSRSCRYNFCRCCIESLITSSKDDYMMASDGNMHVKVFLHCPNCRSDLSPTIRDTVLLRKADTVKAAEGLSDEELTASQLRFKQVLNNTEVQEALADARKRESEFFGKDLDDNSWEENENNSNSWDPSDHSDDEEMGVEVDLHSGIQKSLSWPKSPSEKAAERKDKVDCTLFQGLEYYMTKDEQQFVTQLMTSGEPTKIASGAEIMQGIRELSLQGQTPFKRLGKMSSVFVLIEESKVARAKAADAKIHCGNPETAAAVAAARRIANAQARVAAQQQRHYHRNNNNNHNRGIVTAAQTRQAQHEQNQFAIFMQTHPLPVRMPKYVELELHDPTTTTSHPSSPFHHNRGFALTFCDDTWDGTIMDAFSKITISGSRHNHYSIEKKKTVNRGVYNVIHGGLQDVNFADGIIDSARNRVLVASVKSEGGRKGVMRGDVVTHVNGEEFVGTAKDLMSVIHRAWERDDGDTLRLVLNAELSTAEALRRRALIND